MDNFSFLAELITSPTTALAKLRERPRVLFPLLSCLLLTAGVIFWYYSTVDVEWLKHELFDAAPQFQKLSEEQRTQALKVVSRNSMLWGGMAAATVSVTVLFALQAVYQLFAGKITGIGRTFKQWFALTCWTALPTALLSSIITALMILISHDASQLSPGELRPLSLNELFFHLSIGQPGQSLLASFDFISLWALALGVIGVQVWSKRSWLFSVIFTLLPTVVVYGVWSLLAFR